MSKRVLWGKRDRKKGNVWGYEDVGPHRGSHNKNEVWCRTASWGVGSGAGYFYSIAYSWVRYGVLGKECLWHSDECFEEQKEEDAGEGERQVAVGQDWFGVVRECLFDLAVPSFA